MGSVTTDAANHVQTLLNPKLTLPLYLYTQHTAKGRGHALDHPAAVRRLKIALYLGIARLVNGILNRGALNNWQRDKYSWGDEIVVITGGSDGFVRYGVEVKETSN